MSKTCNRCGIRKPLTDYYRQKYGPDGRRSICKACHIERDSVNQRRRYIKKAYGLEWGDYLELQKTQNNSCAICGIHESEQIKFALSVDHCHDTGKVRGLLCNNCNNGLGRFKDKPELLESAIRYLKNNT